MPHDAGVLRVFRASVKPGREEEWERVVDQHDHGKFAATAGLLGWYRGKPVNAQAPEYVFVTIWRDMDALRAYAGATAGPVLLGTERELAESISVEHYQVW
ncbi:MAG: hypothetical protein QOH61_904 [Chloroflexota bacterium]|jgi:heme-degrading monooxygenase HmoA|nr:hypothetical protein [Chloroflexota bacterium]